MNYPHPLLAREGWPFILISVLLALGVHGLWGGWAALPLYVVAVFVIQFFRDPPRAVPELANAVLSPADGRIVVVEKTQDPYAGREALSLGSESTWTGGAPRMTVALGPNDKVRLEAKLSSRNDPQSYSRKRSTSVSWLHSINDRWSVSAGLRPSRWPK